MFSLDSGEITAGEQNASWRFLWNTILHGEKAVDIIRRQVNEDISLPACRKPLKSLAYNSSFAREQPSQTWRKLQHVGLQSSFFGLEPAICDRPKRKFVTP